MTGWTILNLYPYNEISDQKLKKLIEETHNVNLSNDSYSPVKLLDSNQNLKCVRYGGYGKHDQTYKLIRELKEEIDKAVVIDANDTTDSGTGYVYDTWKVDDTSNFYPIGQSITGEEGEVAEDVAQQLYERHELPEVPRANHYGGEHL